MLWHMLLMPKSGALFSCLEQEGPKMAELQAGAEERFDFRGESSKFEGAQPLQLF